MFAGDHEERGNVHVVLFWPAAAQNQARMLEYVVVGQCIWHYGTASWNMGSVPMRRGLTLVKNKATIAVQLVSLCYGRTASIGCTGAVCSTVLPQLLPTINAPVSTGPTL